jgi:hypothetical protein
MDEMQGRDQRLELRVTQQEMQRLEREAARRSLTVSAYVRLALIGEAQRDEERDAHIVERVAAEVVRVTDGRVQDATKAIAGEADRAAEGIVEAVAAGLAVAVRAMGQALPDEQVDEMVDQMLAVYRDDSGEANDEAANDKGVE